FKFFSVTSFTLATYCLCNGYIAASCSLSKSTCDPYRRQKPAPVFCPVLTAVGTASSARRIPPCAIPLASRTIAGGVAELNSIAGADGGGVPSLIQCTM